MPISINFGFLVPHRKRRILRMDFFLTAANLGCVFGTAGGGLFIDGFGMGYVVLDGLLFSAAAAIILWGQSYRPAMNPLKECIVTEK